MSREEVRRALIEQGGGMFVTEYPTPEWRRIVTDVVSPDGRTWRVVADGSRASMTSGP